MEKDYVMTLLPNGDIRIIEIQHLKIESVYHKTYNPGEKLKENLLEAYKIWEQLKNDK